MLGRTISHYHITSQLKKVPEDARADFIHRRRRNDIYIYRLSRLHR
jgi:hypothetical protein